MKMNIATLIIAQLIATCMNGLTGARARRPAAMALNIALALIPHHNMEVVSAIIVLRVVHATMAIAQLTAMRASGVTGVRAQRPVAMAVNIALAL
jgi:hypothetical protein